jgi:hypothetical protein
MRKTIDNFASIADDIDDTCTKCASKGSLVVKKAIYVWRLDINIPEDWRFGEWYRVKICWVRVAMPILECLQCGCKIKVIPSFLIKGTRLTMEAQCFVTLCKEVSGMTWRDLCTLLSGGKHVCAHSTLYVAVHGIGKFLSEQHKELFQWAGQFVKPAPDSALLKFEASSDGFAPPSARFVHTLDREMGARCLVFGLVADGGLNVSNFLGLFYYHLSNWCRIWSSWTASIPRLYPLGMVKRVRIVT